MFIMPSIFEENLFDDLMRFPAERAFPRRPLFGKDARALMRTDIKENGEAYEMDIDLPGYGKEDITARLDRGYLTVCAARNSETSEKDCEGTYIRRERCSGKMSRSFYIGDAVKQEDIKAKFENGVLKVSIPKAHPASLEREKYIAIEG